MAKFLTACGLAVALNLGLHAEWRTAFCENPTWGRACVATNTPAETYIDFYRFHYPSFVKRHHGFTIVSRGTFAAKTDGTYRFRFDGLQSTGAYRVKVDGYFLDCQPEAINQTNRFIESDVPLKAGKVPIAIFGKSVFGAHCARMKLFVKEPGAADFTLVDPEPDERVTLKTPLIEFEHEFKLQEGILRYAAYRTWTVEIPDDGCYEFIGRLTMIPRFVKACLDGKQFLTWTERQNVQTQDSFWWLPDTKGSKQRVRLDFFNSFRKVLYLTKGKHTFDVMAMQNPFLGGDDMPELMGNGTARFGLNRLRGKNAAEEVAFELEGRPDAMVFERGKGFTLVARCANAECRAAYDLVVRTVRETNEVFRQRFTLNGIEPVKVQYPAPTEGAFEYWVEKPSSGNLTAVVEGPWAFAVADPTPLVRPRTGKYAEPKLVLVDSVDCTTEGAGGKHEFREHGRSEVFESKVGKYRRVGPVGGKTWSDKHGFHLTFDWYAYTLAVRNPHRCHVVRVKVPNDLDRFNTVMGFDRKTLQYNGWIIRSGVGPETGDWSDLEFYVWPNTHALDVMVLHGAVKNINGNGKASRRSAAKSIEIFEYEGGAMPVLPEAKAGWDDERTFGWYGEQTDLYINEHLMPQLWNDDSLWVKQGKSTHVYRTWQDIAEVWERFGELAAHRGDSLCWVPSFTYNMQLLGGEYTRLMWPSQDPYIYQSPHAELADPCDRDMFMLALMKANKYGVKLVADFMPQRLYPEVWAAYHGMPSETNGFYLTENAAGKIYAGPWTSAPMMNPCHPVARKHFVAAYRALGLRYGKFPAFAGIRTRQWGGIPGTFEPTWQNAELGFDDYTVAKFAAEESIADLKPVGTNEQAFAQRKEQIRAKYLDRWNRWRCDKCFTMYEAALAGLREGAPQAKIWGSHISDTTSCWRVDRGLDRKQFENHRELGYVKGQLTIQGTGVELGGLYLPDFAAFNTRPGIYANPSNMTSMTYPSSICCASSYLAAPYHLEQAAKALADGELVELYAGGEWCPPPPNESLRRFVQAYRAIPVIKYRQLPLEGTDGETVSVWSGEDAEGDTWIYVVNRTDLKRSVTIRLDTWAFSAMAAVSGETAHFVSELETELDAFMPMAWRVSGSHAPVGVELPVTPRERERIEVRYQHLLKIEQPAQNFVERKLSTERRAALGATEFGGKDEKYTLQGLLQPMKEFAAAGRWREVAKAIDDFDVHHRGFYEAFGWPKGFCVVRDIGSPWDIVDVVRDRKPAPAVLTWKVGEARRFPEIEPKREFLCLKKGEKFSIRPTRPSTHCHLFYTGLFGGGYGAVRVESKGRVLGYLVAGVTDEPRIETRRLPVEIDMGSVREITLVPEGEQGAAFLAVWDEQVIGEPIAKWRLSADAGKTWQTLDLAGRRLIEIDKFVPHTVSNVVLETHLAQEKGKERSFSFTTSAPFTGGFANDQPFMGLKKEQFWHGPMCNAWVWGYPVSSPTGTTLRVNCERPTNGPWQFGFAINY